MLVLRRASLPLRSRGFRFRASSSSVHNLEPSFTNIQEKSGGPIVESPELTSNKFSSFKRFYHGQHAHTILFRVRRGLSSQSGSKSSGEGNELVEDKNDNDLTSAQAFIDDAEPSKLELEILDDADVEMKEKSPSESGVASKLFDTVASCHGLSVSGVLDKWIEEGNELVREDISLTMSNLCKLRMYGRALQFSQWLEESKQIELEEEDYSCRVDLTAKLLGIEKAKSYIEKIPESFRGELVYRTLLANYVKVQNVIKAEYVFNKMISLGFPVTLFTCNQMVLLYKRNSPSKIANVLELMQREGLNPSLHTYRILLAAKGELRDIAGMESVLETMKSEGIELDPVTLSVLAKCYAFAGFSEKALAAAKRIEGDDLAANREFCTNLLYIYGLLGLGDEMRSVWRVCEADPTIKECIEAISSWGNLNEIEEAEAVFEKMLSVVKNPSEGHFIALLKVYASHKMLSKGKELVRCMEDSGISIGPITLSCLVKLYVSVGDIEKADSVLDKASNNKVKPLIWSFVTVLDQHAKRGDVANAEKVFKRIKEAGYALRFSHFQILIQAYINAEVPACGMRERLKAENIFVNSVLTRQLDQLDLFRKTTASDMLY